MHRPIIFCLLLVLMKGLGIPQQYQPTYKVNYEPKYAPVYHETEQHPGEEIKLTSLQEAEHLPKYKVKYENKYVPVHQSTGEVAHLNHLSQIQGKELGKTERLHQRVRELEATLAKHNIKHNKKQQYKTVYEPKYELVHETNFKASGQPQHQVKYVASNILPTQPDYRVRREPKL